LNVSPATDSTHYGFLKSFPNLKGILLLPYSYLSVSNVAPWLNADMLNIWYPVAYLLKDTNSSINSVPDSVLLFSIIPAKIFSLLLYFTLLIIYSLKLFSKEMIDKKNIYTILLLSCILFPFIVTGAHENHFFFASILLIISLGFVKVKIFHHAVHLTLIIQFFNLFALYGYKDTTLNYLTFYKDNLQFPASIIQIYLLAIIVYSISKHFIIKEVTSIK
jgi:hypothetical protein